MRTVLAEYGLASVCQAARCPNAVDCWNAHTATFMLLGTRCTRNCRFCDVETGWPQGKLDPTEARRVAGAVRELGTRHVVLTSVDRDDLKDGGAAAFADVVRAVSTVPSVHAIEVLLPDFGGDPSALETICSSGADVLGHNLETVRRLTPHLRDARAGYERSLDVLDTLKRMSGGRRTKSGIMVGLGETKEEILGSLRDLRSVGVDIVTVGQYLQPSADEVPVARYLLPEEFVSIETRAREFGFAAVVAGPLVRSSYHAADAAEIQ